MTYNFFDANGAIEIIIQIIKLQIVKVYIHWSKSRVLTYQKNRPVKEPIQLTTHPVT